MNLNIFSDLRKPGLVPGESLSLSTKFDSVIEKNQTYIMSNRMRSLHMHIMNLFLKHLTLYSYSSVDKCQIIEQKNIEKTKLCVHFFNMEIIIFKVTSKYRSKALTNI